MKQINSIPTVLCEKSKIVSFTSIRTEIIFVSPAGSRLLVK